MTKHLQKVTFGILALGFPFVAFAASANSLLTLAGDLITQATPIVVALALLFFFYGLAIFILNQGNEEKKKGGKNIMIWGIVALFVMVSVWGLVGLIQDTLQLDNTQTIDPPSVNI